MYSGSLEDPEEGVSDILICAVHTVVINDLFDNRGELQIAEVASRFTDVKEFEKLVASVGFRLVAKVCTLLSPCRVNRADAAISH